MTAATVPDDHACALLGRRREPRVRSAFARLFALAGRAAARSSRRPISCGPSVSSSSTRRGSCRRTCRSSAARSTGSPPIRFCVSSRASASSRSVDEAARARRAIDSVARAGAGSSMPRRSARRSWPRRWRNGAFAPVGALELHAARRRRVGRGHARSQSPVLGLHHGSGDRLAQ